MYTKQGLRNDFNEIIARAHDREWIMTSQDAFALGYLAGKYGLSYFLREPEKLIAAIEAYDATDDLGLLDTISETLVDLEVIKMPETIKQGCGQCGSQENKIVSQCMKCGCAVCEKCPDHESKC